MKLNTTRLKLRKKSAFAAHNLLSAVYDSQNSGNCFSQNKITGAAALEQIDRNGYKACIPLLLHLNRVSWV